MGSDTSKFSLDAISFGVFDCPHSTPRLSDEGPFMARTQDIRKGYFDSSVAVRVDEEVYAERTKRVEPAFGDVLFSREGTYFGDAAEVPKHMRVCLGQRMVLIRPNPEIIRPSYLRMQINSAYFQAMLRQYRDGTVAERLNLPVIRSLQISVPPLPEQDFVIRNISPLEKKIELNRQINATLEAMAQALFKSWFVDFDPVIDNALAAGHPIPNELAARAERRAQATQPSSEQPHTLPTHIRQQFPDRFVFTEEMGWVPEGWKVSTIGAEVETTGGGTPSTKDDSFWKDGTHPFCTPKDMSRLTSWVLMDTERYLTDAGVKKVSSGQLPIETVLMSSRAPIGYLAISDIPVSVNQGIIAMLPNPAFGPLYLLNWAKFNMPAIIDRANGSTFLEISKKNFQPIPFIVPHKTILQSFNAEARTIHAKILKLSEQIDSLTILRDALLPKLLSGQLRIPEAEQLLAEAL